MGERKLCGEGGKMNQLCSEDNNYRRWNLNDRIKVKLTGVGVKVHFDHFNAVNKISRKEIIKPEHCMPKIDEHGYTEYQLWDFMNIFGEHMHMGAPNVIDPIELTLVER